MFCFKCLDVMSSGDIKQLEVLRSECSAFKSNQCMYIPKGEGLNAKIFDRSVALFPEKFAAIVPKIAPSIIIVVMLLSLALSTFAPISKPVAVAQPITVEQQLSQVILRSNTLISAGYKSEAFVELSYAFLHTNFETVEQQNNIHELLLSISREAEIVSPSKVYTLYEDNAGEIADIFQIRGIISQIIHDPLYGDSVIISDTKVHERESLMLFTGITDDIDVGDSVTIIAVPEFVSVTQPLLIQGWVQP